MPATYEPIATTTLGSGAASITFSSIPSTYTDLRVVLVGTATSGGAINIQFNGDTTSNYSSTLLYGDGSAAASQRLSATSMKMSVGDPGASIPMFWTMDVFSYAGSTNKTALAIESNDANGSGFASQSVGLWRSTAAINEVYVWMGNVVRTFKIGTTATLYGIKNA